MELIAQKYRVLKTLGQGAMGEVYLVLPSRGDPVALKLLKTDEASNQELAVQQFENEFQVLKKLSHPNIGRIFDYGYDDHLKKVYFTSPWLKGTDLFTATFDKSFGECEEYFVQLLRAVNYLHQKELIHCDLKPGNIFVEQDQIQLIDFGLAGYWGESIVGTPTYLAPEVFRGDRHSVASDLYALGVIFYNCLSRSQPFAGKTLQEVYDRHRTHTPPQLHHVNPNVPSYFSEIVQTLLAKKPEERYLSAAAVIEEISAFSEKKYSVETSETLLSYLPSDAILIGRQDLQWQVDQLLQKYLEKDRRTPFVGLFLHGENGVGKSRFINYLKSHLQLAKISVEEALLPLSDSDRKVLSGSQTIILEDVEDYLDLSGWNQSNLSELTSYATLPRALKEFLSFLEQKILSPDLGHFLLVVSSRHKEIWSLFKNLFPEDGFYGEKLHIPPFNQDETKEFLETIIGQEEIPESFVTEVYRNTGGSPALCEQIIENMISQGLLFDESGRWNKDLIGHLEVALKKFKVPQSLEEMLRLEFESLNKEEREIVEWLALAPYGLKEKLLRQLNPGFNVSKILSELKAKEIVREEEERYYLYRSAMNSYINRIIPQIEQKKGHTQLAQFEKELEPERIWYHQSRGNNPLLAQMALEKLADALALKGNKEGALECYQQLNRTFVHVPLHQRMEWSIKTSEILIWLDKFDDSVDLLSGIEKELNGNEDEVPLKLRLALWEKKGLSLLHRQDAKQASLYFSEGIKLATKNETLKVEEIRFLNDLAQIEVMKGEYDKAISKFHQAREMTKKISFKERQQVTNNDLGHIYYRLQRYEEAVKILKEDINLFEKLPYKEPLARAVYTVAECYRGMQKFSKSINQYQLCVETCKKDHLFAILLRAYNGLGNVYLIQNNLDKALENYQKAIEISVHLKDVTTKAALLANQGLIYMKQKNSSRATRRYLMARQILETKKGRLTYENQLLSHCYNQLAILAKDERDSMKAISFQMEHMKLIEKEENLQADLFQVHYDLAELYYENRLGKLLEAELTKLNNLASTDEEVSQVEALLESWAKIQNLDQESTLKVQ